MTMLQFAKRRTPTKTKEPALDKQNSSFNCLSSSYLSPQLPLCALWWIMVRGKLASTVVAVVLASMIGAAVLTLQASLQQHDNPLLHGGQHQQRQQHHARSRRSGIASGSGGRGASKGGWNSLNTVHQSILKERASMPNMYDYDFTWTIFITPQGFEGIHDRLQRRAIESWIRLYPRPKVVLVGKEKGYDQVAQVRFACMHTHAHTHTHTHT